MLLLTKMLLIVAGSLALASVAVAMTLALASAVTALAAPLFRTLSRIASFGLGLSGSFYACAVFVYITVFIMGSQLFLGNVDAGFFVASAAGVLAYSLVGTPTPAPAPLAAAPAPLPESGAQWSAQYASTPPPRVAVVAPLKAQHAAGGGG